ncbi:MAG TPA: hypothetical protein VF681_00205 [Abditibacteriaceae bacterium]|jgi:hypothetical protein
MEALPAQAIDWLDFPHSSTNARLQDDQDWLRLDFLNDTIVQQRWKSFWPPSGKQHHWDAIARIMVNGQQEWLLVEAKAHVKELQSSCGSATTSPSRQIIEAALDSTRAACNSNSFSIDNWTSPYYQYANRLAALHFLTSQNIPARLLHIYFCGELGPQKQNWNCPAAPQNWQPYIRALYKHLDLDRQAPLMQRVHSLFLSVHPNAQHARRW